MLKNLEHEKFCQAYVNVGSHTFNSAVRSYADAYDFEIPLQEKDPYDNEGNPRYDYKSAEYRSAQAASSRVFKRPDIKQRIKEIWMERFEDQALVDARLQEIILSGKDTDSTQAIKIYNDLKRRITKQVDVTSGGRPLGGLTDDELRALAED